MEPLTSLSYLIEVYTGLAVDLCGPSFRCIHHGVRSADVGWAGYPQVADVEVAHGGNNACEPLSLPLIAVIGVGRFGANLCPG